MPCHLALPALLLAAGSVLFADELSNSRRPKDDALKRFDVRPDNLPKRPADALPSPMTRTEWSNRRGVKAGVCSAICSWVWK